MEQQAKKNKIDITKPCRDATLLNKYVQVMWLYAQLRMNNDKKLPPLLIETVRTQDRQNYLYCQGRSIIECISKGIPREFATTYCNLKAKKVTWTLNSKHKKKCAVDVIPINKYGEANWDGTSKPFTELINYMCLAGFEAGAHWKQKDYPHFQVVWDGKPFGKTNTPVAVVRLIQRRLNAKLHTQVLEDGIWGTNTTNAVKAFNKKCKVLIGTNTLSLKAFTELLAME